jgi:hypothetical protein
MSLKRDKVRRQVAAELGLGRVWRARDLLQTLLTVYDPELFEEYGRILLNMKDIKEGGKWVFLSGRRCPAYAEAIATFLEWHGREGGQRLYDSFPCCARLGGPCRYPVALAAELAALGIPEDAVPAMDHQGTELDTLITCGAGLGCLWGMACLIVGAVVIIGWLVAWITAQYARLVGA